MLQKLYYINFLSVFFKIAFESQSDFSICSQISYKFQLKSTTFNKKI